jgi:two-component system, sensor histidine kinase
MNAPFSLSRKKLVVVIDDDPLVLEATGSLIRSWGCDVVVAPTYQDALERLRAEGRRPDLIVSDYRLSDSENGVDAIEGLRHAFEIPALLITGDGSFSPYDVDETDFQLLYKPVSPTALRDAVSATVLHS